MRSAPRLLTFLLAATVLCAPALVNADSALVTKSGTLYEVFRTSYGEVIPGAPAADARMPVVALRRTQAGTGTTTLEIVRGTDDSSEKGEPSIEYEETTGTAFVVYTKFHGLMSELRVAVRRNDQWVEQDILPNRGLYLSVNPQTIVTRQRYIDFDGKGGTISKMRSILHLVWWEESGALSQARYAAAFVEDGVLRLDSIKPENLNEVAGAQGPTPTNGLPFSAYQFPAIERDPITNGGVVAAFANLYTKRYSVVRISFPDDITKMVPNGVTIGNTEAYARLHRPVGRSVTDTRIPGFDTPEPVGTVIGLEGQLTFYWVQQKSVRFVNGDAPEQTSPTSLAIRPDFPVERALAVVREMARKN